MKVVMMVNDVLYNGLNVGRTAHCHWSLSRRINRKFTSLITSFNVQSIRYIIVNRGEGLEAGGVAKLCYCSLSRDNTGASKSI
jgi:hypothetical protein